MDTEVLLAKTVGTPVNAVGNSTAPAGAWEWDLGADRWTLSRGLRQICGMGEDAETSPTSLRALMHPEDLPYVQRTMAAALADARPFDFQLRIVRGGDGAVRRIHVAGDFVSDDHGLVTRAWGSACDVTDTAGAAEDFAEQAVVEALRASEDRYRQLADNAPMATVMVDYATGKVVFANSRALDLFETPLEEALGAAALGYYANAADREELVKRLETAGQVNDFVVRMRTARGGNLWVVLNATFTQYEGRPALHAVYQDITERMKIEEELRQSERRYRLLAENIQDVVWLMDLTTNEFTYVSPSVLWLRGYTAEEVMTMPAAEALTPESQQIIAAHIEKALPSFLAGVPHDPPALELEQPRKDGTTVWTEAIGRFVLDEETGHIDVYGLSRDLTERKAKEEEIRRLNNELEQRVMERTAQLEAALAELRQNEAAKDAFLASISHELRTPLTGILALADALEMQTAGPLNGRQQYFLARIRDSGDRLLKMVTSILEYTALIAGKTQFRTENCVLIELGAICLRDVREGAAAKQLSMHLEVNPADLEIASDPDAIRKLLGYLLDNAVKFTPQGGSAGVEIVADGAQEAVVLTVWDTGIGIDPAKRDAIFRPFEQVDSGLNRQYEGAGLGLACVYQLVKGLGGSIAVESTLGAGSRFSVTLPLVRVT
jgi:PAS domain S-box-containing protein